MLFDPFCRRKKLRWNSRSYFQPTMPLFVFCSGCYLNHWTMYRWPYNACRFSTSTYWQIAAINPYRLQKSGHEYPGLQLREMRNLLTWHHQYEQASYHRSLHLYHNGVAEI